MKKSMLIGVACAALAGCATPYQEMGFLGGVSATQITSDTFQVTARGNGYTDPDTIQRYALRKAAETTIANGFDYFVIGGDRDRSTSTQFTTATAHGGYGWASGFAMTNNIFKPGETVLIKTFKGTPPNPMPPGMFDAREIVRFATQSNFVPTPPKAK